MVRVLVLLLVLAIVLFVARRVFTALLQLRVGAVPEGVDVPEVKMMRDRGWQVTRKVHRDTATIKVEHPDEGVRSTWTVQLRDPGASRELERAMAAAGSLVRNLTLS